jgi:hypothetical protein
MRAHSPAAQEQRVAARFSLFLFFCPVRPKIEAKKAAQEGQQTQKNKNKEKKSKEKQL